MTGGGAALMMALLVGHFLGDFTPLLTERMREAKENGRPLGPIVLHGAVHGVLTLLAVAAALGPEPAPCAYGAGAVFVTHSLIDAVRARLGRRSEGLHDPDTQLFWTALGLDQLAHAAVLVAVATLLL